MSSSHDIARSTLCCIGQVHDLSARDMSGRDMAAPSETSGRAAERQTETIVVTLVFDLVLQSACIYGSIHFAAEVQALCISELSETEHPSEAQLPY